MGRRLMVSIASAILLVTADSLASAQPKLPSLSDDASKIQCMRTCLKGSGCRLEIVGMEWEREKTMYERVCKAEFDSCSKKCEM